MVNAFWWHHRTISHEGDDLETKDAWQLEFLLSLRPAGSGFRRTRGSYVHYSSSFFQFNRRRRATMLLEHPAGPYDVGATTFALPVRPAGVIGKAALRTETGQITPALRLEEVSFTAYYPASLSPGMAKSRQPSWLDWVPRCVLCHSRCRCRCGGDSPPPSACRPLAEAVRGYSRFTGKPLTPDSDMARSSMSALLALTFNLGNLQAYRHLYCGPYFSSLGRAFR